MNEQISTNAKKLINVKEVASSLGVPVSWIYQRTRRGPKGVPHIRVGKHIRFNLEEVISYFKQGEDKV